ncbi:hypothetical protein BKA82DRAFT_798307 [Pisolithus tinctorius]|uniref:F-box domain-containing protein n=1 Tax=Pisolithus tinctorius Marx 270 TaxID=870435 RepID=A0A0C3PDF2_PISTI|nr:hypothetical protein BKA82DRAFT_798307 [Pisolithus tinctorius]KIO11795.1 hypothetical protein M404DRAFT_798307 [Pisolithus tinctorius Marx 270]
MDELDEARAELDRMGGTERTLFKQVIEIPAAMKTQKSKVNDLVKKGPPAINFLPVEILSQIILQSLPNCDDRCELEEFRLVNRRTNLSTVSRFWGSAILGTPKNLE